MVVPFAWRRRGRRNMMVAFSFKLTQANIREHPFATTHPAYHIHKLCARTHTTIGLFGFNEYPRACASVHKLRAVH